MSTSYLVYAHPLNTYQAPRFPSDSFPSLKYLLAATSNSEILSYYATVSVAEVVETSRKTAALKRSDGTLWSVEELIAMQFAYVKELAETLAGEKVSEVIVTVPPYYTQFERDAVVDAIEISGLRTLALVNDGTAVAVNYAMTRSFPSPEYHIIYDAGASSIRTTLVSFTSIGDNKSKSSSPATHVSVAAVGFDRRVGGTELDRRLRNILVDDFMRKHRKDIRQDKRAMTKFWKEAQRVKTVLSANAEAVSTVGLRLISAIKSLLTSGRSRVLSVKSIIVQKSRELRLRQSVPISKAALLSPSSPVWPRPD
jgi:hypoxia up-regulated 1